MQNIENITLVSWVKVVTIYTHILVFTLSILTSSHPHATCFRSHSLTHAYIITVITKLHQFLKIKPWTW